MPIDFNIIILKEDNTNVSYCPELDVSSCGGTVEQAGNNLKTAVRLFLEEAEKMGTLNEILEEARFKKDESDTWIPLRIVATELASLT